MSEILFADDDAPFRRMLGDALSSAGHQVREASDGAEALAEVRRQAPDLVLLDYRMGTPDGFEVCRRIKDDPRTAHIPVLILTGEGSVEDRLGGFDAGADDYLAKPFDPRELLARVTALLRQARRALDRNPTTGLPGGNAIGAEIERRRHGGEPFSVCYFDLDFFKPFSDHFGFAVADEVIREAAAAVAGVAQRAGAFVGHVGGDDFVVVCATADGRRLAEEARDSFRAGLRRLLPAHAVREGRYRGLDRSGEERDFPLTELSAAVVRIRPERWVSLDHLGRVVAAAKHRAKHGEPSGIAEIDLSDS